MPVERAPSLGRIVIVGNDDVAAIAAAMIARAVTPPFIAVVHLRIAEPPGPWAALCRGTTLTPAALEIADAAGWNELTLLRAGRGNFLLGSVLRGFGPGVPAFLPFGALGEPLEQVAFHHLLARRRARDPGLSLSAFVGASLAVQAGRFAPPPAGDAAAQATFDYGLFVDADRVAQAAATRAAADGVCTIDGTVALVERDGAGRITAIITQEGTSVTGDLFVDCGNWLEDEPAVVDWNRWLPCDRLAAMVREGPATPTTAIQLVAHPAGWQRQATLAGAMVDSFAYCDAAPGERPQRATAFRAGRCAAPWQGNCVAIGDGAMILDPVVDLRLSLVLAQLARLVELLPAGPDQVIEAREYNRRTIAEMDAARDVAIAHYCLNGRLGDPFWDACRAIEPPASLADRVDLYRTCARVAGFDGDVQSAAAWIALLDALGVRPDRHDSLADLLADDEIDRHLAQQRNRLVAAVGAMPPYPATARLIAEA